MGALPKDEIYTTDFIESLPEGERAELFDGEVVFMSPPMVKHQRLVHYLDRKIGNYVEEKGENCEVLPAPVGVYLTNDIYNYVEPDITVTCDKTKITDKGIIGAPDWVIEIVSNSSRKIDYSVKLFKYKMSGVREYWIVDPDKDRIMVYRFDEKFMEEYTFEDKVKVGIYDDLEIDFSEINLD